MKRAIHGIYLLEVSLLEKWLRIIIRVLKRLVLVLVSIKAIEKPIANRKNNIDNMLLNYYCLGHCCGTQYQSTSTTTWRTCSSVSRKMIMKIGRRSGTRTEVAQLAVCNKGKS
jgi:hypothetical protein